MKNRCYLRIKDNGFSFAVEGFNDILETDILITGEDYNNFFELQSQGKQFKLKETPTGTGLFDYIEEYTQEVIEEPRELGTEDYLLDLEYRISKLELGV